MAVAHISLNFGLGSQCRNGVHDYYVYGTASSQSLYNLKSLFAKIRLRYQQVIGINP